MLRSPRHVAGGGCAGAYTGASTDAGASVYDPEFFTEGRADAMHAKKTWQDRLLPVMLLLFIVLALLLPVTIGSTYATRSRRPEHILTYTAGKLTWDGDTLTDADGWAKLSLFDSVYDNVQADGTDALLAPGTEKTAAVRLKNAARGAVRYTAVLWYLPVTERRIPAQVTLDTAEADAPDAALPSYIPADGVIRTVRGEIPAGQMRQFDICWKWDFEDADEGAVRDALDTWLGDRAAGGEEDELAVGFTVIVEDSGQTVTPDSPETGVKTELAGHLALMGISLCVFLLLLVRRRKERSDDRETHPAGSR